MWSGELLVRVEMVQAGFLPVLGCNHLILLVGLLLVFHDPQKVHDSHHCRCYLLRCNYLSYRCILLAQNRSEKRKCLVRLRKPCLERNRILLFASRCHLDRCSDRKSRNSPDHQSSHLQCNGTRLEQLKIEKKNVKHSSKSIVKNLRKYL